MNVQRLRVLQEALRADSANPSGIRFDMEVWGRSDREDFPVDCRTQACALGFATTIPEFSKAGLNANYFRDPRSEERGFALQPTYLGNTNFAAASAFFDIRYDQALFLFDSSYYHQKTGSSAELAVVEHIELLIQEYEAMSQARLEEIKLHLEPA